MRKREGMTMAPRVLDVLRAIVGHFCKERGLFPDACFTMERIGEDCDEVFVFNTPPLVDQGAQDLHDIFEHGVAECLDRDCLQSISLCIHDTLSARVIEELVIQCDGVCDESWRPSFGQVVQDITRRQRLLVQTLSQLPKEVSVGVRLNMISGKTPYPAWTPPFFLSAPTSLSVDEGRIIALRSLQDTVQELQSGQSAGSNPIPIAFDPEFTETQQSEPRTRAAFTQCAPKKALVAWNAVPIIQKSLRPAVMSVPLLRSSVGDPQDKCQHSRKQGGRQRPSKRSMCGITSELISQGARKKRVRSLPEAAIVGAKGVFVPVHPIVQIVPKSSVTIKAEAHVSVQSRR